MLFTLCQVQEKCMEQNTPLYAVFINFTKAFISREALRIVFQKLDVRTKSSTSLMKAQSS